MQTLAFTWTIGSHLELIIICLESEVAAICCAWSNYLDTLMGVIGLSLNQRIPDGSSWTKAFVEIINKYQPYARRSYVIIHHQPENSGSNAAS